MRYSEWRGAVGKNAYALGSHDLLLPAGILDTSAAVWIKKRGTFFPRLHF
jgi:hypothetical protein